MIPNIYFNVAGQQVSKLPVAIAQIEGYFKGATADAWLQVHDSCTTPAAGAVPIWQMPISQTSQFFENLQVAAMPITEGIYIGISTTDGTFTASADTMDLTVWTSKTVPAATVVGDKTTALNTLQVWAEAANAAGTKLLYGLIITERLAASRRILVYADDATTGRILADIPLAASQTVKLSFGSDANGLSPRTAGAASNTATVVGFRQGCTVVVADAVPAEGVAPTVTANSAYITAITN